MKNIKVKIRTEMEVEVELPFFTKRADWFYAIYSENPNQNIGFSLRDGNLKFLNTNASVSEAIGNHEVISEQDFKFQLEKAFHSVYSLIKNKEDEQ